MLHVESQPLLPRIVRLELDRLQAKVADVLEPEGGWFLLSYDMDEDGSCLHWYVEIWKIEQNMRAKQGDWQGETE